MELENSNLFAVIVCYHPQVQSLKKLCEDLKYSNCKVILVDNSDFNCIEENDFANWALIKNNENLGIASAQNTGIARAMQNGAEVIIFFDQDSKIKSNFVGSLIAPLVKGLASVSAPVYFDEDKGFEYPSIRINSFGLVKKVYSNGNIRPYQVDVVISSGSAATIETFESAGLMDEDMFIDFVDTEWCLRCKRNSIPINVVPNAIMVHTIGITTISLLFITLIVHSPTRCYYQIRNCFHLFRKDSVPFLFAMKEGISVFINKLLLLLFIKNRIVYIKFYYSAIVDGICGVTGSKSAE